MMDGSQTSGGCSLPSLDSYWRTGNQIDAIALAGGPVNVNDNLLWF
jgi:hypothetical protein